MADPSPRERLAGALALVRNTLELPVKAGVSARQVANALKGRPVTTNAYLRICTAIRLDPAPGRQLIVPSKPSEFDFAFFAMGFKIARGLRRHTDRQAAKAIEVAPATICRIELGHVMSIGVVLRACEYIDISPFSYCVSALVNRETSTETRVAS